MVDVGVDDQTAIVGGIWALVNIYLRLKTAQPVHVTTPPGAAIFLALALAGTSLTACTVGPDGKMTLSGPTAERRGVMACTTYGNTLMALAARRDELSPDAVAQITLAVQFIHPLCQQVAAGATLDLSTLDALEDKLFLMVQMQQNLPPPGSKGV